MCVFSLNFLGKWFRVLGSDSNSAKSFHSNCFVHRNWMWHLTRDFQLFVMCAIPRNIFNTDWFNPCLSCCNVVQSFNLRLRFKIQRCLYCTNFTITWRAWASLFGASDELRSTPFEAFHNFSTYFASSVRCICHSKITDSVSYWQFLCNDHNNSCMVTQKKVWCYRFLFN